MNRQSVGPAGPLSLYAKGFQETLEGRGYAPDSVRWRLRQLAALDRWLRDHHLAAGDLDAGCVAELVAARRAQGRTTLVSFANFRVPLIYLREIGAVPGEASTQFDPVARILQWYRSYLLSERGLADSSISVNVLVADRFCRDVLERRQRLEELTAAEVTAYAAAVAARSSVGWSKKTVTTLSSFLRFLHVAGVTAGPLAAALPKVAGHRRSVPCELGEHDFQRLLSGCDRSCDAGIRDYAILTVLWRLGLRRSEVAWLQIDDIDWRRGEITVRGKGNRHDLLPIPVDVGETIVRYLREGHRRVPPGCRALFVQVRAPLGAMSPIGVGDVVTRVSRRVGLPVVGPHRLRHGTATQLARSGAPWPEIAQVMRHHTIAVTASYATIAPALTRELARPWPGAR